MNLELEQLCGQEMRTVAREYADGRFNKEEYRNRRRQILQRCLEKDLEDTQDMPVVENAKVMDPRHKILFWWRTVGLVSLLMISVLVFLIYRIS